MTITSEVKRDLTRISLEKARDSSWRLKNVFFLFTHRKPIGGDSILLQKSVLPSGNNRKDAPTTGATVSCSARAR